MMFLAVDIGNSATKFGLFKEDAPFEMTFSFPTVQIVERENKETALLPKLQALGDLSSIIIASVVPNATEALQNILRISHSEAAIKILKHTDIPIVNKYLNPTEVGIDRLIASYAAYSRWGKAAQSPVIVVGLGTATTFDCINAEGEYLGGAITLGIESSAKHLHEIAAQLPEIELDFPKNILGTTTIESIKSGILNGAVEMIEGMVAKFKSEVFADSEVVVTASGGLANLFEGKTTTINHIAPHLVLEGIATLALPINMSLRGGL